MDHAGRGVGVVYEIEVLRGLRRLVDRGAAEGADPGQTVPDIEGVGDLALLAVAHAVDAAGDLLLNDLPNGLGETRIESGLVEGLAAFARCEQRQQIGRARQAADMGGQDAIGAQLHRRLPSSVARLCASAKRAARWSAALLHQHLASFETRSGFARTAPQDEAGY